MAPKSTILIVDDEQVGCDTLEALLFSENYSMIFANDGFEALAKAGEFQPDVILLDIMMPGMDGCFEVCRKLRADPILAEVPVIMVTALDDHDSRLKGIEAGADDFVSKPFDRMELRARIRTTSRLNRYQRLLSERAKFQWVVDQAEDGYLMVNAQDEIVYANTQARQYIGLPGGPSTDPEQFLSIAQNKGYHCHPQEAWQDWPDQTLDNSPLYLVQPASSISDAFWLQVDRIGMDGEANQKYLIRLRDVTAVMVDRRSQWAFHAQVGHKLRTPLSLLDGFLDFLLANEADLSADEKATLRSKVRQNALQLKQYIRDIFEYVKAEDVVRSGQGQCKLADLPAMVDKIGHELNLKTLNGVYPGPGHDSAQVCLPLSGQALDLILRELFENACKFHPQQNPSLEVCISEQSGWVKVQVMDDGVALSTQQLSKIWTPYYQAEQGFSGQVPGMGLGLAMVATLVWSAGGYCRAYNRIQQPGLVVELSLAVSENDPE